MDYVYAFHLASGLNSSPNRRTWHEASMRGHLFIAIGESYGSARRWWTVASFLFEALDVTSHFIHHRTVKLVQRRNQMTRSGHLGSGGTAICYCIITGYRSILLDGEENLGDCFEFGGVGVGEESLRRLLQWSHSLSACIVTIYVTPCQEPKNI